MADDTPRKLLAPGSTNATIMGTVLDEREVRYNLDTKRIHVGDGVTPGGYVFATAGEIGTVADEALVEIGSLVGVAQAWADSDTPPDPTDPASKSAKTLTAEARASAELANAVSSALVTYTFGYIGIDDPTPPADIDVGDGYVYTQNARVYGGVKTGPTSGTQTFELLTSAALVNYPGGNFPFSFASSYPAQSIGYALQKLGGVVNYGTMTTGVNEFVNREASMAVNASGTSRAADVKWSTRVTGTGNITEARPFETGTQLYFNGTATFSYGLIGYHRVGLDGTYSANVTSLRGIEWHVANEGNGTIDTAQCFQAGDVDFRGVRNTTGTGTINKLYGFRSNNLQGQGTDAGRVSSEAFGFVADDISQGAAETAGFVSRVSSGSGKWSFLGKSGAPSAFFGPLRLGDNVPPTDVLETNGYAKFASNGLKLATGGYHESSQHQSDYTHYFRNRHASAPQGIIVHFTDADPNNTSRVFLQCRGLTTDRLRVYANGSMVNATNSYGAISDATLKDLVGDAGAQLPDILALRVRKFRFIDGGPDAPLQIGLIAQEVEEVSPGLVSKDEDGLRSVAYSVVNMKMLKAFQELAGQVAALTERVAQLEGTN